AISYEHPDPVVAATAVHVVTRAFVKAFRASDDQFQEHRLAAIGEHETRLRTRLGQIEQQEQDISRGLGLSNVDEGYTLSVQRLALLESKLVDVQLAIGLASGSATQPAETPAGQPAPGLAPGAAASAQ